MQACTFSWYVVVSNGGKPQPCLCTTDHPLKQRTAAFIIPAQELLAVPAIPLTMTAGAIFGVIPGTAIVSVSATAAAAASFLIARYVAHDKVQAIAQQHPRWAAIDRAIGKDSFRVVTLLRLSPLLPLAVSNYLYGLTSVELMPYVLGSWLGMLPGTCAYVAAGAYGADALAGSGSDGASRLHHIGTHHSLPYPAVSKSVTHL